MLDFQIRLKILHITFKFLTFTLSDQYFPVENTGPWKTHILSL